MNREMLLTPWPRVAWRREEVKGAGGARDPGSSCSWVMPFKGDGLGRAKALQRPPKPASTKDSFVCTPRS